MNFGDQSAKKGINACTVITAVMQSLRGTMLFFQKKRDYYISKESLSCVSKRFQQQWADGQHFKATQIQCKSTPSVQELLSWVLPRVWTLSLEQAGTSCYVFCYLHAPQRLSLSFLAVVVSSSESKWNFPRQTQKAFLVNFKCDLGYFFTPHSWQLLPVWLHIHMQIPAPSLCLSVKRKLRNLLS